MKKLDVIIIIAVLAVCGIVMLMLATGDTAPAADVFVDGQRVMSVELKGEMREYTVSGALGELTLVAGADGIGIARADCPNHTCVRSGVISRGGQVIACLPNHVLIQLSGVPDEGVDAVAQ